MFDYTDERMDGLIGLWMDKQMEDWMNRQLGRWMDTDQTDICLCKQNQMKSCDQRNR